VSHGVHPLKTLVLKFKKTKKPLQERLFAEARKIYLQVAGKYLAGTVLFILQEYTKLCPADAAALRSSAVGVALVAVAAVTGV